uniref:Uncharacterized protein n=1 Tax=Lactuca sativa TaxID=4236 RepID=A0A9R1VQN8_LACSA|nr:hypothetical protein LSAT_V11C400208580 [Lactuca sativa]
MSNTRSRRSLDDLPLELLSRIFVVLGSESAKDFKEDYETGGDPRVYRTECIDMFKGMGPKNLKLIYLYAHVHCILTLNPCLDKELYLLDAYFAWAVPDDGEYIGVVDSTKELLWVVDVFHRLTTNNITFQCEDPRHSVKGALAIGHEEIEDRQRYCMVCRWYVEYDRFCIFLKNING